MSTPILKKCIEELQKESFRKDYVLGMLETLVGISDSIQPVPLALNKAAAVPATVPVQEVLDEAERLEAETIARIRNIGPLEA